jgi:septin family protein
VPPEVLVFREENAILREGPVDDGRVHRSLAFIRDGSHVVTGLA